MWVSMILTLPSVAAIEAASGHNAAVWTPGVLIALIAIVPHEHLHALAARSLGLQAQVHWSLLTPHSQSEGILRMWEVPLTSLAPQTLTVGLSAAAMLTRSPTLTATAITHALASVGDYANAAYALMCLLRPQTRYRVLLNGTGNDVGLYQRDAAPTRLRQGFAAARPASGRSCLPPAGCGLEVPRGTPARRDAPSRCPGCTSR